MRKVIVLGSTGSIGTQALEVIAAQPDSFVLVGISGNSNLELLHAQAKSFGLSVDCVAIGAEAASQLVRSLNADVVVNGITGSAGLASTLAALETGKILALANKESLIVGGELVKGIARPGQIVPVDSEHSAIAQALRSGAGSEVSRLILTASGGPFRGYTKSDLGKVTPAQALNHPTWKMGKVVTTNSATLVNKGLEVIEAHLLFDLPFEQIAVTVHPQSIVHSMVEFTDGCTMAQLSMPDMRLPIGYALAHPNRIGTPFGRIDWSTVTHLDFSAPDTSTFRCLSLAYQAGRAGGTAPAFLSAANEVAVEAFLAGSLKWPDIAAVVDASLQAHVATDGTLSSADIIEADRTGREVAHKVLSQ